MANSTQAIEDAAIAQLAHEMWVSVCRLLFCANFRPRQPIAQSKFSQVKAEYVY